MLERFCISPGHPGVCRSPKTPARDDRPGSLGSRSLCPRLVWAGAFLPDDGVAMNEWEARNRLAKARKLAAVLFSASATDWDVVHADSADWKMCAELAGVHPPGSAETVEAVRKELARLYQEAEAEAREAADWKAEAEWQERQMMESGADRCPPKE